VIQAIVFLPLLAPSSQPRPACDRQCAVENPDHGALFISCALSWPIFLSFVGGSSEASVTPVLHWVSSGALQFNWELRVDALTR